ncbi:MAG: hypothetical protein ACFFAH_17405 [Promethearchaeota archaeon]
MKIKNWREFSFLLMIICIIQFLILTTIAMFFYPGGNMLNPNAQGYSFFENFISDLGRTKSISGKPNITSLILYTIAGVSFSISLILFVLALRHHFKDNIKTIVIANFIMILGIISAIFMMVGYLTPWDIFGSTHVLCGLIFTSMGVITLLLYAIAILYNEQYSNRMAIVLLFVFSFVIINLFIITFLKYNATTIESLIFQVSLQKFTLYSFLISLLVQGFYTLKLEKIK